jgi:hypothetical protein
LRKVVQGRRCTDARGVINLDTNRETCNEPVYDSDAPPPAPPKAKRVGNKKKEVVTAEP